MLIAGASGHALELLGIMEADGYSGQVVFYDDVNPALREALSSYTVLHNLAEAQAYFRTQPAFCLGVGNPNARRHLADKLKGAGGMLSSVISSRAHIGLHGLSLGTGLNVMTGAVITEQVAIGEGTLIHVCVSVHHDTVIGNYCELSPGCRILGGAKIGSGVSIGTNAVVMRNISIGDNAIVGAGAVVTRDVPPGVTVAGIPAKLLRG